MKSPEIMHSSVSLELRLYLAKALSRMEAPPPAGRGAAPMEHFLGPDPGRRATEGPSKAESPHSQHTHTLTGRDWGQEEKGTTEDEMAAWHH